MEKLVVNEVEKISFEKQRAKLERAIEYCVRNTCELDRTAHMTNDGYLVYSFTICGETIYFSQKNYQEVWDEVLSRMQFKVGCGTMQVERKSLERK